MDTFKEKAVRVYRDIAQLPLIEEARITASSAKHVHQIELKWKQTDIDRGKNVRFAKSYLVQKNAEEKLELLTEVNFQRDTTLVQKESYSCNGKVKAVLLNDKCSKDEQYAESHQYIEVWQSDKLVKCFSIKNDLKKKHGKIHVDNDQFSSFQLSSDGSKLLYVAEKKRPEAVSFFRKTPDNSKDDQSEVQEGAENEFQDSWGEQLADVIKPIVVVLSVESGDCVVFDPQDRDVSTGKARWLPGSNTELVFVGYNNQPRKLGFIYCVNKSSHLYSANTDTAECSALYGGDVDITSPRFNPQGTKLIFLEFNAKLPSAHLSCAKMKMLNWKTKEVTTVIDIVHKPKENGFTGIYNISFPFRCWDSAGEKVYFSDTQKTLVNIVCIDTITQQASYITNSLDKGTYFLLDVIDGLMVFSYSRPSQPSIVFVSELPSGKQSLLKEKFCKIAEVDYLYKNQIKWDIIDTVRVEGSQPCQSFVISPVNPSAPPPLIVWPHGGPHTSFTANFITWVECLSVLGFSIVMVNYHGSSGFGQDFLESLPGNVGTLDVQDVQYVAETVVNGGSVDKDRVAVTGGSHGGFLTGHLIGQYPDFYKAAFIRNPVINMAAMSCSSDIPDWCYYEAGLPYSTTILPNSKDYSTMLEKSPISHARKIGNYLGSMMNNRQFDDLRDCPLPWRRISSERIKAAVIIALGGEDRRCPSNQGKQLYYTLKAQGNDVSLYWYPKDCHPLMSVDTTGDCFMHLALHFYKHCMQ